MFLTTTTEKPWLTGRHPRPERLGLDRLAFDRPQTSKAGVGGNLFAGRRRRGGTVLVHANATTTAAIIGQRCLLLQTRVGGTVGGAAVRDVRLKPGYRFLDCRSKGGGKRRAGRSAVVVSLE